MFGCLRHILPVAMGFFGVTAIWAAAGYLPQMGPVPLRFRTAPTPATRQFSQLVPVQGLPAAPLPQLPVTLPAPAVPAATAAPASAPAPVSKQPAVEYDARDFGAGALPAPRPDLIVSPQMLLKYFMPSTNGTETTALAPVGFTPPTAALPKPIPQPSSHPTNSTTP